MHKNIRLSVCITTRNRGKSIAETLETILVQCPADVEVVVVDGASTDDTPQVVARVAQRFPQLRFLRQEQNSGLDADYDKTVQAAAGEYCWLFSDDDLVIPGAMEQVLAACRSKPVVVVVDASVHNADFTRDLGHGRLDPQGPAAYSAEHSEAFFRDCAEHLSFIGCLIVQRSFWLSRERPRYYGSEFIHCGVLFQAPLPGAMLVIRKPLVQIRYGVGNWKKRAFEVWMYKWPSLIWSFEWISEDARNQVIEREPWTNPKRLLQFRGAGFFRWRDFATFVVPRSPRVWKLWKPVVYLAVPAWAALAWLFVKARLTARPKARSSRQVPSQ